MAETFEDRFYAAVSDFIQGSTRDDGTLVNSLRVTSVQQETYSDGYCETCWYEYIVLEIHYIDAETGNRKLYIYHGDMAGLMRELS